MYYLGFFSYTMGPFINYVDWIYFVYFYPLPPSLTSLLHKLNKHCWHLAYPSPLAYQRSLWMPPTLTGFILCIFTPSPLRWQVYYISLISIVDIWLTHLHLHINVVYGCPLFQTRPHTWARGDYCLFRIRIKSHTQPTLPVFTETWLLPPPGPK